LRFENWEGMKLLKKYDIDISKLNLGQFEYSFQIDDLFFELFDYSIIDHGSLKADLVLEKTSTFISLHFKIVGIIKLVCDRSLDVFDYKMSTNNELVLRFGDENMEISDQIEIISYKTQMINVASYIYEFISVAVPMKKLHPRYADEPEDDQIIYTSGDEQEEKSEIDPRWIELKKLKHKD